MCEQIAFIFVSSLLAEKVHASNIIMSYPGVLHVLLLAVPSIAVLFDTPLVDAHGDVAQTE